jgi:hypothetical protein
MPQDQKYKLTPTQSRAARRVRRNRKRRLIRVGAFVSVASILFLFIFSLFAGGLVDVLNWGGEPPVSGDHWHASYSVSVCGESIPHFAASEGGVHSHGDRRIHIHPRNPSESGSNATLALFFASVGGALTNDSLTLPSGERYVNGDLCSDGKSANLFVRVNGSIHESPISYVMQDTDEVIIDFHAANVE